VSRLPEKKGNIIVYGHAIDPAPTPAGFNEREGLFFLGAFVNNDTPNSDAVKYFIQEVYPLVYKELKCKLIIGGACPTDEILALATDNIVVKGFIDDPETYYNKSKVFIIPHRYAGGIPWKLSESLAKGVPTVTSKIIANQMGLDRATIGVGTEPWEIAQEIISMYTDPIRWNESRETGLEFIKKTHDPVTQKRRLVRKLKQVMVQ